MWKSELYNSRYSLYQILIVVSSTGFLTCSPERLLFRGPVTIITISRHCSVFDCFKWTWIIHADLPVIFLLLNCNKSLSIFQGFQLHCMFAVVIWCPYKCHCFFHTCSCCALGILMHSVVSGNLKNRISIKVISPCRYAEGMSVALRHHLNNCRDLSGYQLKTEFLNNCWCDASAGITVALLRYWKHTHSP